MVGIKLRCGGGFLTVKLNNNKNNSAVQLPSSARKLPTHISEMKEALFQGGKISKKPEEPF